MTPSEPLRKCSRVGWQLTIQDPCLVQQEMGRVFTERLFGIPEIRQGDNEVMARVDLKDWFCCRS